MSNQDTQVAGKITVEDLVDSAIVQGFKNVGQMYMESLEEGLRKSIVINEAGDAQNFLQEMINCTQTTVIQQESAEQLDELNQKMSAILGRK